MTPPSTAENNEERLYVGYRGDNSKAQGRFTRAVAIGLVLASLAFGASLAIVMSKFDPGIFEFGSERTLEGRIQLRPQPLLRLSEPLERPANTEPGQAYQEVLLVAFGKNGAGPAVAEFDGEQVALKGTLIAQGDRAMFEVNAPPERIGALEPELHDSAPDSRKPVQLIGEIVDSKCFLGVMKPGRGKSHKACAALCIAGGIPPAFLVRAKDPNASPWVALLLDEQGEPIAEDLRSWLGQPLRIQGQLITGSEAETPELWVDFGSMQRL